VITVPIIPVFKSLVIGMQAKGKEQQLNIQPLGLHSYSVLIGFSPD